MEKVIYNLVFNRKKQLNSEGKALIQVEAYLNKQKKYFSTKVYVKPFQWDAKRKAVKNHPNMESLNQYLTNFIAELEQVELEVAHSGKEFSLSDLKEKPDAGQTSFSLFMKNEITQSNLKQSTLKNHFSTLQVLSSFQADVSFNDLSFNFLCDFEHYMLVNKYHRNTIAKHMKHLKRYINLAINKDLFDLHRYPFRKYKIKYMESKRTHLTPEELEQLESLNLKGRRTLQRTLDMFLFSCYTGLRFSDIVSITKDNFLFIEDKVWLIYSSVKTDVHVRLPLFLLFDGKSLPIYERYKNNPWTLFDMPVSSNSNVNKQLRRICKMANVDKKVSFHTARHTNATLLLYNGANITTVQKLLGHKSVRTTEIYSNIMDMTVVRDLSSLSSVK
ncbi:MULTISPECIES: site-specific integrase [unclassified Parabacteroides]|jgi:integrase|uniref:site-specific integrase n=1 Tax=unclassified Parabacteroides TaxID=2649774 RepID=UPI000EFEB7B3|nr:site-specific integrase [Parabacteroides sp. TM07-1AC]RHU27124.1 site-specific integrase [Parabacteroides sp. TM07-1AC]